MSTTIEKLLRIYEHFKELSNRTLQVYMGTKTLLDIIREAKSNEEILDNAKSYTEFLDRVLRYAHYVSVEVSDLLYKYKPKKIDKKTVAVINLLDRVNCLANITIVGITTALVFLTKEYFENMPLSTIERQLEHLQGIFSKCNEDMIFFETIEWKVFAKILGINI
ncbi:MAG: hypothetical protein QXX03_05745 [Nitrososphaerota archaeon]